MFSKFRELCSSFSNRYNRVKCRISRWLLKTSNYKWQLPNYKECRVKDQEWKDKLCRHPAYKDLCRWVVDLRDREIRRLMEGKEDSKETVAKMKLLETMYNDLTNALRSLEQDVD